MNKLHLQYLQDTGKHPTESIFNMYLNDNNLSEEEGEAVSKWLDNYINDVIHTPEYIQWLEEKLNYLCP